MKRQTKDIAALVALRGKADARDICDDLNIHNTRDRNAIERYLYLAECEGLLAQEGGVYEYIGTTPKH